jgi:hypothetical protein
MLANLIQQFADRPDWGRYQYDVGAPDGLLDTVANLID